jgi:hypothetical protein
MATAFVNHFSCLPFVHLQESTAGAETFLVEAHAASFGVKVSKHRADNVGFAELLFVNDARESGQTVSLSKWDC